jgi:hypothetical protein
LIAALHIIVLLVTPLAARAADDSYAEMLEQQIDSTAQQIDLALAGKKYTREKNESSIKLKQLVSFHEVNGFTNSTDVEVNLRLPNLEKRFQARFSTYNQDEEERQSRRQPVRTTPREKSPGAGLLFFQELGNVRTTFQPQLQLKDPLFVSYRLRFESNAKQKKTSFSPKLELFANPEKGTGELVEIWFKHQLTKQVNTTVQVSEEYSDYQNLLVANQRLSFGYPLSDLDGLGLSGSLYSQNQPVYHLESITASLGYSRIAIKDRLEFSISPFLEWSKPNAFHGYAGISLNVDVIF